MSLNPTPPSHLKTLYKIFITEDFEGDSNFIEDYKEEFEVIFKEIGNPLQNENPMKFILNHIYENDDFTLLKRMLSTCDTQKQGSNLGFDYDIDNCDDYDFERGDWSEENDARDNCEDEYGEEGTDYYYIYSKNLSHVFSKQAPFGVDLDYSGSVARENNP